MQYHSMVTFTSWQIGNQIIFNRKIEQVGLMSELTLIEFERI